MQFLLLLPLISTMSCHVPRKFDGKLNLEILTIIVGGIAKLKFTNIFLHTMRHCHAWSSLSPLNFVKLHFYNNNIIQPSLGYIYM